MSDLAIGIDLGCTRIKAVVIDESGKTLSQRVQPTEGGGDAPWKYAVRETFMKLQAELGTGNATVGMSAPGLPNSGNTAIAFMPGRLQGLENLVWSDFLHAKTYVLNDAVAALMAEARFGAARNKKNVVMLTLGTGVGGAILIEGKAYQGSFNKAGHIGHMVIDSEGEPDIIGIPGSLEDAIGDCTIEKRSGGRFSTTSGMIEALGAGDSHAAGVWLTSVRKLAVGLASLTNILSPEMIILGGGITEAGKELFDPLEKYLESYEWRAGGHKTTLVKAEYGEMAGAAGAAIFALEAVKNQNSH